MSKVRHHVIIVTSWNKEAIHDANTRAKKIFGDSLVTGTIFSHINGYRSFMVGPDGSNEGWEESAQGDEQRDEFIEVLKTFAYEDGSSSIDWLEVQYGEEGPTVCRHST